MESMQRIPLLQQKLSKTMQQQQKDQIEYDAGHPFVLEVKYDDGTQKEYEPMTIDEDDQHKTTFFSATWSQSLCQNAP